MHVYHLLRSFRSRNAKERGTSKRSTFDLFRNRKHGRSCIQAPNRNEQERLRIRDPSFLDLSFRRFSTVESSRISRDEPSSPCSMEGMHVPPRTNRFPKPFLSYAMQITNVRNQRILLHSYFLVSYPPHPISNPIPLRCTFPKRSCVCASTDARDSLSLPLDPTDGEDTPLGHTNVCVGVCVVSIDTVGSTRANHAQQRKEREACLP